MLLPLDLRGYGSDVADRLPRPDITADGPTDAVREIIADVRERGDASLVELTSRFDGVDLEAIAVPPAEIAEAVAAQTPEVLAALDLAVQRLTEFHQHQKAEPQVVERDGVRIEAFSSPSAAAGLYVPGGRAAYPSTVIHTAVPAKVAGVERIIMCCPPDRTTGRIASVVLAAAAAAGIDEIYAVGGAQAVAAMAYGTESIRRVDVIAGPGNVYVALAKQMVAGDVGIAAAFAGPSEVVVVADDTADARYAAIDVLLQAEHGPDGLAWLVTWDPAVADAVDRAGEELLAEAPRADEIRSTLAEGGYVAIVDDPDAALAVVDAIAPEHLELQCRDADSLARRVRNAGAIFCGDLAPASLGDYVAGPSHVLPTYGSARFSSALTVADFVRDHHIVTVSPDGLGAVGPATVALAQVEGLDAHARSVQLRLDDLGAGQPAERSADGSGEGQ